MKLKSHLENNISATRTIQIQFEHEALQSKMKQLTLLSECFIIIRNKNKKIVRITYDIEYERKKDSYTENKATYNILTREYHWKNIKAKIQRQRPIQKKNKNY